ncbi:MAG: hypothetical protein JWM65_1173 [Sphingomonas bacterium]|nr:hypothetical protein [Sphingomonas bacterium]
MIRLSLLLPLLPAIIAASPEQSLAAKPAVANFVQPELAAFAVPDAGDHVVVLLVKHSWGPPGGYRVTITRSGRWLKEEAENATTISDLRSGASYYYVGANGKFERLSISGPSQGRAIEVTNTGKTDRLLGETCTIWRFIWKGMGGGIADLNCLTRDNILLWQRVTSDRGDDLGSARAVSIVRRNIRPAEFALPDGLVRLSTWFRPPVATATVNDEVQLGDAATGRTDMPSTMRVRRFGDHRADLTATRRGRDYHWAGGGTGIRFSEDAQGRPARLDFEQSPKPGDVSALQSPKPVTPRKIRSIMDRSCVVTDMAPGVSDFGQIDCRTENDLMLARTEYSRGGMRFDVVATRISIGMLTPRDMMPPDDLLDPARWFGR